MKKGSLSALFSSFIMIKNRSINLGTNGGVQRIGSYKVVKDIGAGGFASVVQALSTKNNKIVAIKIFPKSNLKSQGDIARFQHEVDTMYLLNHPNLVKLHDFFWDDTNFYLVLDYCAGGDLLDFIINNDKFEEPVAALVFKQIISAVAHFHSFGVAHRDLKPENILISEFPQIKVTDFGLCGYIDEYKLMTTFCGSPSYSSPECMSHMQYDGKLSDIWSLGVILYVMVTGETPWNTKNQSLMTRQIMKASYTIPSYISQDCKNLIQSMLVLKPSDRPPLNVIIQHPWFKLADQANEELLARLKMDDDKLPLLQPKNIVEMSVQSHRADKSESGIFSPVPSDDEENSILLQDTIEEEVNLQLENTDTPSLPQLVQKQKKAFEHQTNSMIPNKPKTLLIKKKPLTSIRIKPTSIIKKI